MCSEFFHHCFNFILIYKYYNMHTHADTHRQTDRHTHTHTKYIYKRIKEPKKHQTNKQNSHTLCLFSLCVYVSLSFSPSLFSLSLGAQTKYAKREHTEVKRWEWHNEKEICSIYWMCVCVCIYICVCVKIWVNKIFLRRERERKRVCVCVCLYQ